MWRSVRQTPQARTRRTSSPGPGTGVGRSVRRSAAERAAASLEEGEGGGLDLVGAVDDEVEAGLVGEGGEGDAESAGEGGGGFGGGDADDAGGSAADGFDGEGRGGAAAEADDH